MDANKRQRYEKISIELTRLVGGRENIQGVAHCATRLRIVLNDNDLADLKAIEDVDLAKGVFVAGDQVQIIFGAGLVNDVYEVFAEQYEKHESERSENGGEQKNESPAENYQGVIRCVCGHYAGYPCGSAAHGTFRGAWQSGLRKGQ